MTSEEQVLNLVRQNEPTSSTEIANIICSSDDRPDEVKKEFEETKEDVKKHAMTLIDKGEISTNLDMKYVTVESNDEGVVSKILGILSD